MDVRRCCHVGAGGEQGRPWREATLPVSASSAPCRSPGIAPRHRAGSNASARSRARYPQAGGGQPAPGSSRTTGTGPASGLRVVVAKPPLRRISSISVDHGIRSAPSADADQSSARSSKPVWHHSEVAPANVAPDRGDRHPHHHNTTRARQSTDRPHPCKQRPGRRRAATSNQATAGVEILGLLTSRLKRTDSAPGCLDTGAQPLDLVNRQYERPRPVAGSDHRTRRHRKQVHDAGRQGDEQTDGNDHLDEPDAQPRVSAQSAGGIRSSAQRDSPHDTARCNVRSNRPGARRPARNADCLIGCGKGECRES